MLLACVLGIDRSRLIARRDVTPADVERFSALVDERVRTGRPVAYLTGVRGFRDVELFVDDRVLVPRPETEGLVDVVEALIDEGRVPDGVIVDRGTGSGALAVVLASRRPVVAVDVSADALAVAARNVAALANGPVLLVRADGLGAIGPGRAAVVVANPPYVEPADLATLDVDVRDHEPHVALVPTEGTVDAMYARLADEAAAALVPGGWFVTEIGVGQAQRVTACLASRFEEARVERDLAGIERVVVARRAADA